MWPGGFGIPELVGLQLRFFNAAFQLTCKVRPLAGGGNLTSSCFLPKQSCWRELQTHIPKVRKL